MPSRSAELENLLAQLITEHEKLLRLMETQQAAMKKLDFKSIEETSAQADAARLRIVNLENRRRAAARQLALTLRIAGEPTLTKIADAIPESKTQLLNLRQKLKSLVTAISNRATVAGRLAGAVLGHLNTVVRLLAGAVEQAGLYTKNGSPKMSTRIGVMEAVG
jgi:hypothetical protein